MDNNELAAFLSGEINALLHTGQVGDITEELFNSVNRLESVYQKNLYLAVTEMLIKFKESQEFICNLSDGRLDVEVPPRNPMISPFKQLHANLSHLVWQVQRLSEGDLNQRIDFLGDFSLYFNRLIQSLREKREIENELIHANAAKDKFFGIIAHDLKNTFNTILGFSRLLVDNLNTYDTSKTEKLVSTLYNCTQNAYKLLENLLDWSLTQTGKITYNPENVVVENLLSEIIGLTDSYSKIKKIEVSYDINDCIVVYADKNMLSTILRNLITNAIKFTRQQGKVIIKVVQNTNETLFTVSDTGIGISPETIEKLFIIEEKVNSPGTNDETGTGLGLLLCKEFVEKHHGKIWVESELGEGSIFKFTIPNCNEE